MVVQTLHSFEVNILASNAANVVKQFLNPTVVSRNDRTVVYMLVNVHSIQKHMLHTRLMVRIPC